MHHFVKRKLHPGKRAFLRVSYLLALVTGFVSAGLAQVPVRIDVLVVEGEGVTNKAGQRVSHDPVVRVEDDDHRPIAGAAVVFALPVSGTSGEFPNGSKTLTVVTDKNGVAAAHGLRTNEVPGKLQIYTTASYRGLHSQALINQFVEAVPGAKPKTTEARSSTSGGKVKWILLGVAAAGGAGAGIYFGRHQATSSPVSISTGAVVFGSPH